MADSTKEAKPNFFKGLKAEFRKIVWPDQETLAKQTVAVVVVSIILGGLIALLDWLFKFGFAFVIK